MQFGGNSGGSFKRDLPDGVPAFKLLSFLTRSGNVGCYPNNDQTEDAPQRSRRARKRTPALRETASYSITSSARSRNDSGIVSPSAFAVFRLITNSNFVGCST